MVTIKKDGMWQIHELSLKYSYLNNETGILKTF